MEVTELTLWAARLGVIALMYILVMVLIFALRADARAASAPPLPVAPPSPQPAPARAPQPAAAPAIKCLVVTAGTLPTSGREYPLFGPLEIGRGESSDITIQNKFVSTHHARIFPQGGQWVVEDLGSTNGTILNGAPVRTAQPIKPGDILMVGDTQLTVR